MGERKSLLAVGAIIAVAILLTLPAAIGPVRLNDSFWIDWVWLDQFARELGRGTLYPRWLPLSHGGLGSPVFYYYPPLAFYVGSLFALAGMATYAALLTTFFAGYVLSGVTMYWWLRAQSKRPLLGALVFMFAPYHTFNFYNRGAIAEFMGTGVLPLVMLGLWRLEQRQAGGFLLTAIAYGALICTHLPLALLASLFLIGPLVLLHGYRAPGEAGRAIVALGAGVALAAVYWLPAIWLEPYRDTAKLWAQPVLQPSNWSFWNAQFRSSGGYIAVLVIGLALALPLVSLIARGRSRWAAYGLVCVLLAIGLVPMIWSLPLLRSVQFPFRLFPLSEFALATAIATVALRRGALIVAVAPLVAISGFVMAAAPADQGVTLTDVRVFHADVPENLPPGERPYSWPSRWALEVASAHRQAQTAGGVTIEPVFYYPSWRVSCDGVAVPTFPAKHVQLLAYRGSACDPVLGMTAPEKIGAAISLAGLLLLAVAAAFGLARRRASS
jgi:hypothetical protein